LHCITLFINIYGIIVDLISFTSIDNSIKGIHIMKNTSIIATSLLVASATTATANNIQPSITIDVNNIELTTEGDIKLSSELRKLIDEELTHDSALQVAMQQEMEKFLDNCNCPKSPNRIKQSMV
jgi:hypothetical protein